MDFVIEELQLDDCKACSDIEVSCFKSESMSIDDFFQAIEDPDKLFYVAKSGGRIVGLCGILVAVDSADILTIAVGEAVRRHGIGRMLLDKLASAAREKGVLSIILEVRASNKGAIVFYEEYGFERISVRYNYYREPMEDAVIMKLVIA
ncbi:MAG: ribosomal protein S18-alanine N-acetyltransferase [Lachnospiraceae bacterium]|nr:ribosomal protein S18-alanine N-acetyltransferase [Lachnospiraceae bacterium]